MPTLLADPLVRLVVATRTIAILGAPVTLLLVAVLRPPEEQGFYFVFTNVQAVAFVFEYGVGAMLVQFAAHSSGPKASHGATGATDVLEGAAVAATLRAARRWFGTAAVVVLAVVLPLGFVLFGRAADTEGVSYAVPWLVMAISVGSYLAIIPFICVLEGSGHLRRVQRMRLIQVTAVTACLWSLIPVVGSLYAIAAANLLSLLVAGVWLMVAFPGLVSRTARVAAAAPDAALHSAQSRTAVAWLAAFVGPQLLAPIVFHYQGPVSAGQLGLSLAAASAPLMFAVSWLQARYPEYGSLAARNQLGLLDATAKRATAQAVLVCMVLSAALLGMLVVVRQAYPPLASRFLPLGGVASLSVASLASLLYQAMAGHLRAHREETLVWPVVIGMTVAVAATLVGARHGPTIAAAAYTVGIVFVLLPWAAAVFVRRYRVLNAGRQAAVEPQR